MLPVSRLQFRNVARVSEMLSPPLKKGALPVNEDTKLLLLVSVPLFFKRDQNSESAFSIFKKKKTSRDDLQIYLKNEEAEKNIFTVQKLL